MFVCCPPSQSRTAFSFSYTYEGASYPQMRANYSPFYASFLVYYVVGSNSG